jgi:hypothetical protein
MMQNREKHGRHNIEVRNFVFLDVRKEHDRLEFGHDHYRGGDQEEIMQKLDSP